MKQLTSSDTPIFQQIASMLELMIISGELKDDEQIPSITEFSVSYGINPATALKGVNILVDRGLLYKKRGLGMFVSEGAGERLRRERSERFAADYVAPLIHEAASLGFTAEELNEMIVKGYEKWESK